MFGTKRAGAENFGIGLEFNQGPVGFIGTIPPVVPDGTAACESGFGETAFAMGTDPKGRGEGIDGFEPDSIESDAELENIIVVLGAGIDLGDAFRHFAEGDAATEIADDDVTIFDIDVDFAAVPHDMLIDGIIDDLFEQDIDAIVVIGPISEATDIHSGSQADMVD